jgi:hypothetical protein
MAPIIETKIVLKLENNRIHCQISTIKEKVFNNVVIKNDKIIILEKIDKKVDDNNGALSYTLGAQI